MEKRLEEIWLWLVIHLASVSRRHGSERLNCFLVEVFDRMHQTRAIEGLVRRKRRSEGEPRDREGQPILDCNGNQ